MYSLYANFCIALAIPELFETEILLLSMYMF